MRYRTQSSANMTLLASFLHFDFSFAIWSILGSLSSFIVKSLGLNAAQAGLLVALPILSGAMLRIPIGILGDYRGRKRVGIAMLLFLFLPLTLGWLLPATFPLFLCIGIMLGVAGASFAIALPLASRWFPAQRQGLVMGIAGAGNSGIVIANVLSPRLAAIIGWHNVMGVVLLPLALILLAFLLLAKERTDLPKTTPSISSYRKVLQNADIRWFCLFYAITFGSFVGLSNYMPLFFVTQYSLSAVNAGLLTALLAFIGSSIRPLGGYLADKVGGLRLLTFLLFGICLVYICVAFQSSLALIFSLLVVGMCCFGMGNGAIFQQVPQYCSRSEIGTATGMVGAIGALGGFLLPNLLGSVKLLTHAFGSGFVVLAILAGSAFLILRILVNKRSSWHVLAAVQQQASAEMDEPVAQAEQPVAETFHTS